MPASRRTDVRIEESIFTLFREIPELCGFTVLSRAGGLELSDVGLYPPPADEAARLIHDEIRDALHTLLDEQPEARRVISGRTFARAVH